MIGVITTPAEDHIVFNEDGSVECNKKYLKEILERIWKNYLTKEASPADGQLGANFLSNLARQIKGKLELVERKPGPKDTIY